MLSQSARVIGWPLTILFAPVLILRHFQGRPMQPEYYPPKAEAFERNEVYANCSWCPGLRLHYEVVWLMPYVETRECSECGTLVEI